MAINQLYSSIARKGKGSGSIPTPATYTPHGPGALGMPGTWGKTAKAAAAPSVPGVPAASAAAGSAVDPSVLPVDPIYDQTIGALDKTRTDTVAGLKDQRLQGLANYGYTEDPTGALAIDPNNPYSQSALLLKNYKQSKAASANSYAERGMGYDGVRMAEQAAVTDNYGQANDSLYKALLGFLAGNKSSQNLAGDSYATNAGIAGGERVARAQSGPANVVTGAAGGSELVPGSKLSKVKLAPGWTAVKDAKGNVIRLLPPG